MTKQTDAMAYELKAPTTKCKEKTPQPRVHLTFVGKKNS